jgi:twitching motility protein PilT
LREDPDVILVGEMRDPETIGIALTAAETGHLVFGTLHTSSAAQTIDRVIDVFPPHQQQQIRVQLANSIQGVIAQQLIPRIDKPGRVVAFEIMVATPAIRNLIREGKSYQIISQIQTGMKYGMVSLDMSLRNLVQKRIIAREEAINRAADPDTLMRMLGA